MFFLPWAFLQAPQIKQWSAHRAAAQKNMSMVGHQRPGVDRSPGYGSNLSKPRNNLVSVPIVVNDPSLFDSPDDDMM
jgi:hypothetical protein